MRSVMVNQFRSVPDAKIPRSSFDRSHGIKTTFDAGKLIPIYVDEALPGDTFNMKMTGFARMATPIFPLMDNIRLETFFFAVPIRLVWDNWQKFNGEQINPGDSIDFLIPKITDGGLIAESTLGDYFGLPTGVPLNNVTSLFHRAYALIWNEWFRDENLQNSLTVPTDDGPDNIGALGIHLPQRRGKRHDYFTSCLPWPQKGDSVSIPLGNTAPVMGDGSPIYINDSISKDARIEINSVDGNIYGASLNMPNGIARFGKVTDSSLTGLQADLTNATAATINQLRQAFQIQKLQERDARGGTRYTEIIRSHFGVISPDQRLQRPEFLGGGSTPLNITPVAQTSETSANSPQGNLSGYGTAAMQGHGFVKSFTEHCILIGLVNARADITYQQGTPRMFSRRTRYDYYWPALAQIGEQAVLNKEIYTQGSADDDQVFGYQERYAEYRYKPSMITGKFRSNATGSLDAWHLSQDFATLPVLNASFIEDNPPMDRVLAVPSEPDFIFDAFFRLKCARPMPLFGIPGLIDHF